MILYILGKLFLTLLPLSAWCWSFGLYHTRLYACPSFLYLGNAYYYPFRSQCQSDRWAKAMFMMRLLSFLRTSIAISVLRHNPSIIFSLDCVKVISPWLSSPMVLDILKVIRAILYHKICIILCASISEQDCHESTTFYNTSVQNSLMNSFILISLQR